MYLSADKLDSEKDTEAGNDLLSLKKLIEEYKISPAQLIELIKNRQLNPNENKNDLSLINSSTADQSIQRNKSKTPVSLTCASSTLKTSSSLSAKINSLKTNTENKTYLSYKTESKYILLLLINHYFVLLFRK
jgi:hypothetical protein